MAKDVTYTVTSGVPFRSWRARNFYVTDSRIDPQNRDDVNCRNALEAHLSAINYAREVGGKVRRTTIEDIADFGAKK